MYLKVFSLCLYTNFNKLPMIIYLLCSILEESGLGQRTFENVAASFHHCFNKQDHFRVGSALVSSYKCHFLIKW